MVKRSDVLVHQWVRALFRSVSLCTKLVPCTPVRYQDLMDLQSWEKSRDRVTGNSFVDVIPTVPKDRKLIISTL